VISDWRTSIAEADMADWVTVTIYFCGALLSARAAGYAWLRRQTRERTFWRITAVLLVFLGVNELLDLQTLLTSIGRAHAKAHGWYGEHRRVQYTFTVALGLVAGFTGLAALWLTRRTHASVRLALVGLVFIGLFVLVRAASFHHADAILGRGMPVFNLGTLQEIAGALIVAIAAALYARVPRRRR
jgi:hypothetical protein